MSYWFILIAVIFVVTQIVVIWETIMFICSFRDIAHFKVANGELICLLENNASKIGILLFYCSYRICTYFVMLLYVKKLTMIMKQNRTLSSGCRTLFL